MRKSSAPFSALTASLFVVLPLVTTSAAQAQETAAPPPATSGASGYRPTPLGVGIGLGYLVDSTIDLAKPTVSSVRLVLTDHITLEPVFTLAYGSTSNEVGMASTDTSATSIGFGTQLRYLLASRGPLDFSGLGFGLFSHGSTSNSVGDTHTSAQTFDLRWGFGIDWWLKDTWSFSLDATNTFISWKRNSNDNGAGPDSTMSTFQFGLIFNPQVMMMTHLFF